MTSRSSLDIPEPKEMVERPVYLTYRYRANPQSNRFLHAIKQGVILGVRSRGSGKVLVPPPVANSDEILAESGGMFYSRETPEHEVYVSKGDHFEAGDPLFIVEVMKMFNKVYAPFSGTIKEVLVESDGTIISKGQPIFKIEPDEVLVDIKPEEQAARQKKVTSQFLAQL